MNKAFEAQIVFDRIDLRNEKAITDNGSRSATAPDSGWSLLDDVIDNEKIRRVAFLGYQREFILNALFDNLINFAVADFSPIVNQLA
ncbi:MAG: hypothetical protein BWX60_00983 [Candidatus Marinimicrobia bacterium ADurb.Bin030]|nr:MAG: hypothetical protein BWX60_00983 [Candidatus Marinimicrobia bacterium ADurb.Bin030]